MLLSCKSASSYLSSKPIVPEKKLTWYSKNDIKTREVEGWYLCVFYSLNPELIGNDN